MVKTALDLSLLSQGDRVQDPLLVLDVETRSGENPHTVLTLGNSTGSIQTAPFWAEDQPKIAGIRRRTVVQVIGEVAAYRDKRQLKVNSIRVLPPGTIEPDRLLPSVGDVQKYWTYLDRLRSELRGPRLRAVVDLFYEDPEFRRRYEACPASIAGHHAEIGGLLKHTSEVAAIALGMAKVAGADLELGRAVRGQPVPPCTEQELAILLHLVLSHHGKQEFGAPVPPLTLEAEVLHYADNASAKTASMGEAIADPSNFPPDGLVSSQGVWQVDRRRVYRGKSDWGREPAG